MTTNIFIRKSQYFHVVALMAASLSLVACVTQPTYKKAYQPNVVVNERGVPNFYKVERGDTVSVISGRYGLNWREVARLNQLDSSNTIYTGQWLMLWKGGSAASSRSQIKAVEPKPAPLSIQVKTERISTPSKGQVATQQPPAYNPPSPPPMQSNSSTLVGSIGLMKFMYPVSKDSKIVRHFGQSSQVNGSSVKSEGMWFNGNMGDAIMASRAGTVIYADANNVQNPSISIRHADGFTSEYRFIQDAVVQQGQNVTAGQRIASMKQTNGAVLMEFRIQKGSVYIDPESVLK